MNASVLGSERSVHSGAPSPDFYMNLQPHFLLGSPWGQGFVCFPVVPGTSGMLSFSLCMYFVRSIFFLFLELHTLNWGFPSGSSGKDSACNAGELGSILGLGRSPGGGNGK